jgi:putative acyl-CoA dehydrogenase
MTYGSVPTLKQNRAIATEWLPRIYSRYYDPLFRPAREKSSALIGMGMTENQGGSDLRTNTTRAEPSEEGGFRLHGHKWFMSAPMCDAFLVLAQAPRGISCFLMPRWRPDGTRNAIRINRLKDKLGNQSNASSEVEFDGAYAELVGEEGRGIPTIIEMGNYTRLDCAIGSSGLMRQAVAQAIHHARHRTAFQRKLVDQPLMTNVLADLALESEAATVLTFRLARAYDEENEASAVFRRVLTPAAKFWICKRAPFVAVEAMEALGGSGYIEESIMPRIYREAPVNSIWEGSGNVMCLDVLRAIARTPGAAEVLAAELDIEGEPRVRPFLDRLSERLAADERHDEAQARGLVRDLVLALQAVLLIKHAAPEVADAFCVSRLGAGAGAVFGLLPRGIDTRAIVERAAPQGVSS